MKEDGDNIKGKKQLQYLNKQEDIVELQINSDIEPDYASFSLGGILLVSNKYVYPAAGGFDIGCGVGLFRLVGQVSVKDLKKFLTSETPYGIKKKKWDIEGSHYSCGYTSLLRDSFDEWQMGEFETGNHFAEILKDKDHNMYVLIHSGVMEPSKTVFAYAFVDLFNKMGKKDEDDNGYAVKVHKDSLEGMELLELFQLAEKIAVRNRCYIAKEIGKKLGLDVITIIDTLHEFVYRCNDLIIHSNGVQKMEVCEQGTEGILLCGYGNSTRLIRGDEKQRFYNHGTKYFDNHGKREYLSFKETMAKDEEINSRIQIAEEYQPIIVCKNNGEKYEYTVL